MPVANYRSLREFDWTLLSVALIISAVGVLQIYSATHGTGWSDAWWRQCLYIAAGLLLMWLASSVDYHTLLEQAPVYYGLSIVGLVAVLLLGKEVSGGKRWIPLPLGFHFQVSEFVKVVLILLIARYLSDLKGDHLEARDLLKLGALTALPAALVMKQPDLGTALSYVPILAMGIFLAGLRWRHVVALLLIAALALPVGWSLLKDYQKMRLIAFLDPSRDPLGAGYQVIQSQIAVGAGGMWGKGVTQGSQTQLRFLPVPHTDFIFSAFAEEHGFVGVLVMLGLYFLLLMQVVQNAQVAADRAGMYIAMGVAGLLLFHLLVNIGMVVGRMPVTGIPLPLMSHGGSSVLSWFIMLGLVNNVRLRRFAI
ncbi:MAG: rod shape-determining protein RodA [Bryobacteraceae bacterium]